MNVGRGAPAIQMSNLNMLVRLSGPEGPFWGPQLQFRCRILAGGEWIRVTLGVVVVCVWRGEAQGQFRCGTIVWGEAKWSQFTFVGSATAIQRWNPIMGVT